MAIFFYLLYYLSSDESDLLVDESDDDGSESGSSGMYSFRIFLCVLTIPFVVLVFWDLMFLHEQDFIPKVVDSLYSFGAQSTDFPSKFQNQFYSYILTMFPLCL